MTKFLTIATLAALIAAAPVRAEMPSAVQPPTAPVTFDLSRITLNALDYGSGSGAPRLIKVTVAVWKLQF